MEYVRLSEGFNKYQLVPADSNFYDYIKDADKDYYRSLYLYDDQGFQQWLEKKTVAGIKDVHTDRLFFDFDSVDDLELARKDAVMMSRLLTAHGIPKSSIQICFTGSKGFSVEVELEARLTPDEFKLLTSRLAFGLKTFDKVVNDPQRLIRLPATKHNKTKLYKLPLTLEQLETLSVDDILDLAKDDTALKEFDATAWVPVEVPPSFIDIIDQAKLAGIKAEQERRETYELDWNSKPKWLSNCRWALQNGYFTEGIRSSALLCLASTYKNQGFNLEHNYRLLKGVAELAASRNNEERFDDKELYNNVVAQVYSEHWKGGQFSCRNEGWLKDYCESLGDRCCDHRADGPKHIVDITTKFKDFVVNIDKNTIKTGISSLDEHLFLCTGMNVGFLGAAGSGKTSIALDILNNTSKAGIKSVFASLDMSSTRIYEKVMYRLTGMGRDNLYKTFQENREENLVKKLEEEFGNVFFFDRSSPTVDDIREYILECQEKTGEKIKLVMVDYFERVSSDVSDDTAASKKVGGQLQDLVNDLDICLITLLQPNKMTGDLSCPIKSYTSIKGSSFLYQSYRAIAAVYREGFHPQYPEDDRFITINILKNDLGEVASLDFKWDGKRGRVSEIETEEEYKELEAIRRARAIERNGGGPFDDR